MHLIGNKKSRNSALINIHHHYYQLIQDGVNSTVLTVLYWSIEIVPVFSLGFQILGSFTTATMHLINIKIEPTISSLQYSASLKQDEILLYETVWAKYYLPSHIGRIGDRKKMQYGIRLIDGVHR